MKLRHPVPADIEPGQWHRIVRADRHQWWRGIRRDEVHRLRLLGRPLAGFVLGLLPPRVAWWLRLRRERLRTREMARAGVRFTGIGKAQQRPKKPDSETPP